MKLKSNISDLFFDANYNQTYVKVCAPMVRYSKVQFRTLVKKFVTILNNFGYDL